MPQAWIGLTLAFVSALVTNTAYSLEHDAVVAQVTSDAPHAVIQPPDLGMWAAAVLAGQDSGHCRPLLRTIG